MGVPPESLDRDRGGWRRTAWTVLAAALPGLALAALCGLFYLLAWLAGVLGR